MTNAYVLELAIVVGAFAWKGGDTRLERRYGPSNSLYWTVAIALLGLVLTVMLGVRSDSVERPIGLLLQLGQNFTLVATLVALQVLYLGFEPEPGRRHSGRREVGLAGLILAVMTIITGWAIVTGHSLQYSASGLHSPIVATFFFLPTLYEDPPVARTPPVWGQ